VVRIATESLQKDGHVYVVDPKNNRLQYRKTASGLANWQFTEIRQGVAAGERLVTTIDRQGLGDGVAVVIDAEEQGKEKKR
jgi:HlyD family secretion protein